MFDLLKFTTLSLKFFAFFIFSIFLAFPISAIFGAIALLFSLLPIIWEILWRTGLGLMMLTSIALFIKGLNDDTENNF